MIAEMSAAIASGQHFNNKMNKDDKSFQQKANEYARLSIDGIKGMLKKAKSKNEEKAEEGQTEIEEDPLEIATGQNFDGTRTYMILLGTGGPAARIIGELDEYDEPETAVFQFQDWFEPWTPSEYIPEDEKIMIEYARHFYFEKTEK